MSKTPPRIVIEGLDKSTRDFLREMLAVVQNNEAHGSERANANAQDQLIRLTGYYNGREYETPKGYKNQDEAQRGLSYVLNALDVQPERGNKYYRQNSSLMNAAQAVVKSIPNGEAVCRAAYHDLEARCIEQGITPETRGTRRG